jgi:hypothetical protein
VAKRRADMKNVCGGILKASTSNENSLAPVLRGEGTRSSSVPF